MNVLVACDKFRGSLTAAEANAAILCALRDSALDGHGTSVAIADGGEGTLEALSGDGTVRFTSSITDPFGHASDGVWLYDRDRRRAVIELAAVAGHDAAERHGYDPDRASSFGVGELIRAALDEGAREIVVAVGGSITVDAGAGALEALGARYFTADGEPVIRPAGRALKKVETIDLSGLDPRCRDLSIVLAADVDNPLCGPYGAARVFGPQKGVPDTAIDDFNAALGHFDARLARTRGTTPLVDTPFAGAAGGVLCGFSAAAPTIARDGFALVFEHHRLADRIAEADLVVTGEGSLDAQSLSGKGPVAVARAAAERGVPCVAFAGRVAASADELRANGILAAFAIGRGPMTLADALAEAGSSLTATARAAFDLLAAMART